MIEVKLEGANKQSSDEINMQNDERVQDNDGTPPLITSTSQQTRFAQSTNDQPLTSPTATAYRIPASVEKFGPQLRNNGLNARRSSLESLENASHVAVVSQCLYSDTASSCYMRDDRRNYSLRHADHHRSNLSSILDKGYSSSEVDGWV